MADSTILPGQRTALVDGNGVTSPEFYRFFRSLSVTSGLPVSVDDLTVRVAALEGDHGNVGNVIGKQSIISYGVLSSGVVTVNLAGDMDAPPALSFYGAMTKGSRGWQTFTGNFVALANGDGTSSLDLANLPNSGAGILQAITIDAKGRVSGTRAATITGTVGRVTVTNGDASAGLPTIDLATVADAGGGTLQRFVRDAWGRLSGTSAATTTDLTEGANLYYTDVRADARIALQKAQPMGLATLDAGGKLDAGQLPALAITETFVVNTQAAMLALIAQEGDVAVRTDLSKSFILAASPASTLANWQELLTPASPVTSVFGRVGSVTAAAGDYTPAQVGAEPTIAPGTTAQYWRGDKTWRDFATDVRGAVLTGLSLATSAVIAATDTVLGALGKLQAQITANKSTSDAIQASFLTTTAGTPIVTQAGDFITVTN